MRNSILACCTIILAASLCSPTFAQDDHVPGVMLVKFTRAGLSPDPGIMSQRLARFAPELGAVSMHPLLLPRSTSSSFRQGDAHTAYLESEMSRVMMVSFSSSEDVRSMCARVASMDGVEYAEPCLTYKPLGMPSTPDDSLFAQQAFLKTVQAEQAWDISKGSAQTVIAVADTDIKWDHVDLIDNIWINPGESGLDGQGRDKRTNGVDDDGNGLVDDWHGWDFGGADGVTPDNDTRSATGGHGTAVAGLASATTNNHIGISSIGYNCKILPIKIGADGGGNLAYGLQAMDYASRMGAKVMNASWGSTGSSQTMLDMVNLATSRGTLIVGGAGNNGNTVPFYPASYPAVLDAAVCNASDVINAGGTYGRNVDVICPGDGALTTNIGGGYSGFGATSAAAPLASGLAGLVATKFPSYTPAEIRERIRVTCDNIDAKNPTRAKFDGKGRINAYRALNDPASPSIRITSYTVNDPNGDGMLMPGEQIGLAINLFNYLAATTDKVTLTLVPVTNAASVQLTKATVELPIIAANSPAGTALDPLTFTVTPSNVYDATVLFRVEIQSGAYEDFDFVEVNVNPSYNTITNTDLSLTVQANGTLGYYDYPDNTRGGGMQFLGSSVDLFLGALMLGTDQGHIVDDARSAGDFLTRDNDFRVLDPVALRSIGKYSAAVSRFNDARADSARRLNVEVTNEVIDPSVDNIENVLFSVYKVHNSGTTPLNGLRAAMYMDFGGYPRYYSANVYWDSTSYYAYLTKTGRPTVATFFIPDSTQTDKRPLFWALNNDPAAPGNPFGTYDGFTAAEKWRAMSTYAGHPTTTAGNMSFVLTSPARDIAPGETGVFVFGHAAGLTAGSTRQTVTDAIAYWKASMTVGVAAAHQPPADLTISALWPNPCMKSGRGAAFITFAMPREAGGTIDVFNVLGERVRAIASARWSAGTHTIGIDVQSLPAGMYFCRLAAGGDARVVPLYITE